MRGNHAQLAQLAHRPLLAVLAVLGVRAGESAGAHVRLAGVSNR
jgi:hypothetical protein